MRYQVTHTTTYKYSEPASLSQNELCLMPRQTGLQKVLRSHLNVRPKPEYLGHRTDFFGNRLSMFMVQQPHDDLVMTVMSVMETACPATPPPDQTPPWEEVARRLKQHATQEDLDAYQFVFASPLAQLLPKAGAYAQPSFPAGRPVLAGAMELMGRIFTEFEYDKAATTVDTSVAQVMVQRKGVCQDFAHLMLSCLRSLGLAARYVSGYLETKPPPGKPKLVGADASHAWVSVYIPDAGWVDLDPTNNMIPGENHVTLAWGRDYGDVTPVKGVVMGGGTHTLSVQVDVMPLM